MRSWRWPSDEEKTRRLELILKLKEQGLNNKQVAPQVGIGRTAVSTILKNHRNGVVCRARANPGY